MTGHDKNFVDDHSDHDHSFAFMFPTDIEYRADGEQSGIQKALLKIGDRLRVLIQEITKP